MLMARLRHQLATHLEAILQGTLSHDERVMLRTSCFHDNPIETAAELLTEDLEAFVRRDPAAHGRYHLILDASSSFRAVMHYRLAHEFWQRRGEPECSWDTVAIKLSNQGKLHSGVDIHPGAKIGARFVLDHAYGTVIGETCRIGGDAYILGGVTLGSLGIANNPSGQRHPTLGNNVQVGAFARVLGALVVGDNVFISPNCVITENIPSNSRISIVNQIQLKRLGPSKPHISPKLIGSFFEKDCFVVICQGFQDMTATVLDKNYRPISSAKVLPNQRDNMRYEIRFPLSPSEAQTLLHGQFHVNLSDNSSELTILNPKGLGDLIAHLASSDPTVMDLEKKSHEYSY